MGERRFPRPDADFAAYMNNYYDALKSWWETQGLDTNDLKPLEEALSVWNTNFPAHVAAQQRAEAARQNKDGARRQLEAAARPVTSFIQGYPKTTDADRATIGITVRDANGTPTPTPTTRPQALVQSGQRLTHTLRLTDESTPTRRARPKGVLGAEVWVKLIEPGIRNSALGIRGAASDTNAESRMPNADAQDARTLGDPATFSFLTMATKPTIRADFRAAMAARPPSTCCAGSTRRAKKARGRRSRRRRWQTSARLSTRGGLCAVPLPLLP